MIELPFEVPEEPPKPIAKGSVNETILAVLAARDREFTSKEVADLLEEHYGMNQRTVTHALWNLSKDGRVTRVRRGVYKSKKEKSGG